MKITSVVHLLIFSALTIAIFAANIGISIWHGRLSAPATYDDVGYLYDAFQRYYFRTDRSLLDIAWSFLRDPPHAPLTTLTAMFGYALAGPRVISPYIANITGFAVYAAFMFWLAQSLSLLPRLLIASTALFLPASHVLINELRPDMIAGVLFGIAIYVAISVRPEMHKRSVLAGIGIFLAFAATSKPSSMVLCVPIIGFAVMIGITRTAADNGVGAAIKTWGFIVAGTFITFAVFLAVFGNQTIAYIYAALVTNAEIWRLPGDAHFHWSYHSFGSGGKTMLGPFFWILLVLIIIDMARSIFIRKQVWESLSYALILIILYFGMATNPSKTVYQGCFFYFPFAIAGYAAIVRLLSHLSYRLRVATAIFALSGTFAFMPAASSAYRAPKDGLQEVESSVLAIIRARTVERRSENCPVRNLVVASIAAFPIPAATVALSAGINLSLYMEVRTPYFSRDRDYVLDSLQKADFVLIPSEMHVRNAPYKIPSMSFAEDARVALSKPQWRKFDLPISLGSVAQLYVKQTCQ